jgi:hypothetical protein
MRLSFASLLCAAFAGSGRGVGSHPGAPPDGATPSDAPPTDAVRHRLFGERLGAAPGHQEGGR